MLKTLKRKIALVAVAGLGFGVISTAPAFAASATAISDAQVTAINTPSDKSLRAFTTATTAGAQTVSVYTTASTVALADLQVRPTLTSAANGDTYKIWLAPGALTGASAAQTKFIAPVAGTVTAGATVTTALAANTALSALDTLTSTPTGVTTTTLALMVMKTLFREAHERGWVDINPTKGIKAPKIRTGHSPFLTWEEVRDGFFGKYDNHIRFLALHGLRWGEATALTKDDIHDGLVHINRSVHGATKTQSGVRTVPYLGYFENFPATRKPLAKVLKPYGVNIHSLRKTFAYLLKTNGVHVTTAQKLLGHASPMVTLSIYTKVLDQETLETGAKLSRSLGLL